ncbi:unnamed protein product [Paramecium octaurelia]|uniref:Uncharacterized protein n=1 Tax=Paramecium octaurelia TaxID=43137 RepID=A0A8S1UE22_PAROT|nr:unnamed protein product [Paramecium octaurelia]
MKFYNFVDKNNFIHCQFSPNLGSNGCLKSPYSLFIRSIFLQFLNNQTFQEQFLKYQNNNNRNQDCAESFNLFLK